VCGCGGVGAALSAHTDAIIKRYKLYSYIYVYYTKKYHSIKS